MWKLPSNQKKKKKKKKKRQSKPTMQLIRLSMSWNIDERPIQISLKNWRVNHVERTQLVVTDSIVNYWLVYLNVINRKLNQRRSFVCSPPKSCLAIHLPVNGWPGKWQRCALSLSVPTSSSMTSISIAGKVAEELQMSMKRWQTDLFC